MIGGVVLLGGGIALFLLGLHERSEIVASESWPATNAIIRSSEITRDVSGTPGMPSRYNLKVTYEYEVDGVKHICTRIRIADPGHTDRGVIKDRSRQYPVGQVIQYSIILGVLGLPCSCQELVRSVLSPALLLVSFWALQV